MNVFKFQTPYKSRGRTRWPETQKKAGVYIIKQAGEIVYIGHSRTNLYKTLYRHFQSWDDNTQFRATYPQQPTRNKILVRIIITTPGRAEKLEIALRKKYNPRDDHSKYYGIQKKLTFGEDKALQDYETSRIEAGTPF